MIRVLHLISGLRIGGAERLLLDILRRVPREEFDLRVASLLGPCDLGPAYEREGVPVLDLSASGRFTWSSIGRLRAHLDTDPCDILHTHLLHAQLIGRWLRWRKVTPRLVSTQHFPPLERVGGLARRLHRWTARREDMTIAISPAVAAELMNGLGVPSARVRIIENGIDLHRFAGGIPPLPRDRFGFSGSHQVIGVTASLTPKKGIDVLLRAMKRVEAQHPAVRLVIVGEGPERPRLEQLIEELGLGSTVALPGTIQEIPAFLAMIDLFCLPSRREPFGLSVAEAMAMGCPVVHTRVPGLASLSEHEVTALQVPPEDPDALAQAIDRMLSDRALANRLRCEAQRQAHERFAIERTVAGHTALWREMAG